MSKPTPRCETRLPKPKRNLRAVESDKGSPMPEIPLGQLLLLIAFILFPLINWLLQRMQRRFEGQAPRQPPAQPVPRTFAKPPPVEVVASARERMPRPDVPKTAPSRR